MVFIAPAVCFIRVYSCTNAVYNAALISAVVISEVVLIIAYIIQYFTDTIDTWDENKLQEVVDKKHGSSEKSKARTEIVQTVVSYCCHIFTTTITGM